MVDKESNNNIKQSTYELVTQLDYFALHHFNLELETSNVVQFFCTLLDAIKNAIVKGKTLQVWC